MAENGFLVITFYSEVQSTSSFHCCAGFDEVFDRTPIRTMMLHNLGGAKWPKLTHNGHFEPFRAIWPHHLLCNIMIMMGVLSKI